MKSIRAAGGRPDDGRGASPKAGTGGQRLGITMNPWRGIKPGAAASKLRGGGGGTSCPLNYYPARRLAEYCIRSLPAEIALEAVVELDAAELLDKEIGA